MTTSELKEITKVVEELCAKGKAYRKKRMAAGEKSSAYLSGRAVKVCKGQMQGENLKEVDPATFLTVASISLAVTSAIKLFLNTSMGKKLKDKARGAILAGINRIFDAHKIPIKNKVTNENLNEIEPTTMLAVGAGAILLGNLDKIIGSFLKRKPKLAQKTYDGVIGALDKVLPAGQYDVDETYLEIDALNENEEYCPNCTSKIQEAIKQEIKKVAKEAKTKPAKGKRFAKKVKNPKTGRTRTVSYGQAGKAKKGGDRIRPGTAKGNAYCARSAKIKKCKNPPCANTLSRKKWKCQGSRSVK